MSSALLLIRLLRQFPGRLTLNPSIDFLLRSGFLRCHMKKHVPTREKYGSSLSKMEPGEALNNSLLPPHLLLWREEGRMGV